MIEFNCPKCKEPLSVPGSLAGKSETCPKCGNVTIVPAPVIPSNNALADSAATTDIAPGETDRPVKSSLWSKARWELRAVTWPIGIILAIVICWGIYHAVKVGNSVGTNLPPQEESASVIPVVPHIAPPTPAAQEPKYTEAQKTAARNRLASALGVLKSKKDKGIGNTFVSPVGAIEHTLHAEKDEKDQLDFYFYVGITQTSDPYLRMHAIFVGEGWIFVDKPVILMIDDKKTDVPLNRFEDVTDDVLKGGGGVMETVDVSVEQSVLDKTASGKEVYVTLDGRLRRLTWKLTPEVMQGIRQMSEYYQAVVQAQEMGLPILSN